jgi:hypothetical protein
MDPPAEPENLVAPFDTARGGPFLRLYPSHDLVTWRPEGTLDNNMLDQISEWLVAIEKVSVPVKRFVDFSGLNEFALRTPHLFQFARKRAEQLAGTGPVRTALFSNDYIGFGLARMYEALMENTPIDARAFRDRTQAANWLGVPAEVLTV